MTKLELLTNVIKHLNDVKEIYGQLIDMCESDEEKDLPDKWKNKWQELKEYKVLSANIDIEIRDTNFVIQTFVDNITPNP